MPDPGPAAGAAQPARTAIFHGVVALSGFAGLGYQMVWSRMLAVSLGHEILAVLAVVAAFFTGLAIGAFALNRRLRCAPRPQYWYAALELVIAAWALLLVLWMPEYNRWLPALIGSEPTALWHWLVAFGMSLLLLLPATAAMGATLPALERALASAWQRRDRVALLYALNTGGAVLGTLLATFVLIPAYGLSSTAWVLVTANLACAVALPVLFAGTRAGTPDRQARPRPAGSPPVSARRLLATLFVTGLLGIGYEVLAVRLLGQVLENTVYTFAAVLAVYLVGTAVGAALYHRLTRHVTWTVASWSSGLGRLAALTALATLIGTAAMWTADGVYAGVVARLGPGLPAAVTGEIATASAVFLVPTLAMGAVFAHLARQAVATTGLGTALGVNTLGSALAPLVFGVLLLPALDAKTLLVALAVGYLALVPRLARPVAVPALAAGTAALALLAVPLPLRFLDLEDGATVVSYQEGVMASVAVVRDRDGHRHLKVNNHYTMGGTASRHSDHRQTHIPMLLHGSPQTALYLGLGTGITFQAARHYPGLQAVGVELVPESLSLLGHFDVDPDTWPQPPRLVAADARRYVLSTEHRYDVIIAEIFHPSRDGAGALYTREHFAAIRARLAPDGVFCQWLPLFQLDLDTLRTIVRTFVEVFPEAQLHLGHFSLPQPILCLAGFNRPRAYPADWLLDRVHDPALQRELVALRLNSDFALFGGYLGGTDALKRFAGPGTVNSDDRPLVAYGAPDFVYGRPEHPAQRLLALVTALREHRGHLVSDDPQHRAFRRRLSDYWQARDAFIAAGLAALQPGTDIRGLAERTREPLLAAVRMSGDFAPAFRTLLGTARALYDSDPPGSYRLLTELDAAAPEHPEARRLRHHLFGE